MSKYSDLIQETYKDNIAEAPTSKYSDLIQEEYGDNQATTMKASVFSSTPVNPDQAAQQYQISKQVNLPVNIVRAKENEIKQMTELNSIDYDAIAKNFPAVATQLSDPNKVGAIRDDVDKLSYFERISKGYKTSQENTELAPLYIKQMLADIGNEKFKLSPAEENQLAFIEQNQQGNQPLEYQNKGGLLRGITTFAKNIPIYTAQAIPTILANIPATLGGVATGAGIGATATRTSAGALVGAGIGARVGTFLGAAQLETGLAYKELKDLVDESGKPIEKTAAAGGAIATGVVNGLLELVPFEAATAPIKKAFSREGIKQIVKTSAGREYLKNIGSLALTEGATEGVQEFFNIAFGEVAKAASKGDFTVVGMKDANDTEGLLKFLSDSSQRVLQSAEAGVGAGLGLGAVTSGVTYAKQIYDQKKQGQAQQEQIKETTQNVKESKTFNRSRELFKDVTEETLGQQNVYIPAEKVQTYFQDKTPQEVEEFYKQVPEAREQLQDALESGGNLILKGNNAFAAFAQDAYAPLEDFASLSPENFTDEAYQDAFLQDVVSNVNYDEQVKKVRTEQDLVNKNIETQIQNLGIPYRDAKDLSTLTKAFYETNLKKYGNEQATKLLNNYFKNLQIKNEVYVDDVAEMLKKARAPQKALPKAGKPLQKFLKEKGGVKLGSNLAGELNALGITPKTAKGLFKKASGIGDVDNIPATEFQSQFPNANLKVEGDYIDRQAVLDALKNEIRGVDISKEINEERALIDDFTQQLDKLGLDLNAPDEEIKRAIDEYRKGGYEQRKLSGPQGQFKYLQGKPIISLFQSKDKSTLLHELGHTFLEIQKELSQIPEISEEATKDWKVLEDWLDIKDGKITVESHEKFARGFEAYLREGKAPSIELRTAFSRFFKWLITIYEEVTQLNVRLNKEVREVFDRMLATQQAIDLQKNNPLFRVDDQVLELLNAKEKEDYLKITEDAALKAREKLTKKALLKKEKEVLKSYKQKRTVAKSEIRQAMEESPVYRALNFFKTGELYGAEEQIEAYKLNEEEAQFNYPELYKKLKNKGIFEKDGVSLDIAAEDFGFKDGGVMLNSLSSAKPFNNELRRATDEEMIRRFGDMLYDGTIEEEAKDAMQNEARANKILYELNGINRKVKSYVENKEAYKQKAQEIFAKKPLSVATDSNQFYIAEVKAAREAGKAIGKKDYEKAVAEKKKQLLNHYLYRESLQLKKELQTAYKKYAKYKKRPAQGKVVLEEEYREKIVELLANFGLAKMPEGVEFSVADLEKWKQKQEAKEIFGLIEFPEIEEFVNKSFKQLTTDEFRTLDDAIENLAHIGKAQRFIEVEGKRIELRGLSESITEQLENIETKKQSIGRPSKTEEARELFDAYMATIIKAKEIAIDVDGGKFGGLFYNSFIEPLASGELKRNKMIKEATKKFLDLRQKYLKSVKLNKKTHFKLIDRSLDKEAAISIGLNWGNEKNRKRIRDGYRWNDAQVNEIISSLTENEWRYIEEIWKFINSYQKDAYAVQKRLTGFTPRIEKALPFSVKTSDGVTIQLEGGYYPLMYVDKTKLGAQIKEQINSPVGSNLPLYKSYTKERAEGKVDKQVNLTLLPAVKHIADVINDIALKEAAWSSNRLLNYAPLRKALKEKLGDIPVETLQVWLEDMFGVTSSYAGIVERILDHIRVGTTISALGASIATTIIQIPGFVQALPDIGYLNTIKGIYKFIGNANPLDINANRKKALEKSKILQSRAETFNQAIYDVLKDMAGKGEISRNAIPFFFYPMQVAQSIPDTIVWYGAYSKGLKDFNGDDAKAVKYADYIVVKTQGSGLTQDLSAIERGSLGNVRRSKLIKLFTAFGTYFVAKFNVARRSFKDTNFKNPVNIAKFMSDMIALYLIEAIAGEIILNRIPDFDDDDEDAYAGYVFKTMMQTFASQFFLGREAVGLSKGYDGTPSGFGGLKKAYQGGEDVFEQTISAFTDEDVEMTKIIKGANKSASVLMHFPSTPIDTLVSAYEKEQEGEDVALIDYFIKPRKK